MRVVFRRGAMRFQGKEPKVPNMYPDLVCSLLQQVAVEVGSTRGKGARRMGPNLTPRHR